MLATNRHARTGTTVPLSQTNTPCLCFNCAAMFRPLPIWIGLRYTAARRRNHFISFISLISMLGIFIGVTALITVLSVMNGFERELRERILGIAAHATAEGLGEPLRDWRSVADRALEDPRVIGVAPYIEGQGMLVERRQVTGAQLRGILPEREPDVSEVHRRMLQGSTNDLVAGEYGIILGSALARHLGVRPGERVTLILPEATVTPAGVMPRLRRFSVVGTFEMGMYEYDRSTAFVHMEDARRLMRMEEGEVTGVRLRLENMFDAPAVSAALSASVNERIWVSDWTRRHANFFQAVQTEKTVMFVILTLIVAVAAFNIVSTLVMTVTDKQADIAILRTLGIAPAGIMGVFLVQGTVIGVVGTLFGIGGGIGLSLNVSEIMAGLESVFGIELLPADVYYLSDLPAELRHADIARIGLMAFGLSILATLYPAWRAARTQPAEALRYE